MALDANSFKNVDTVAQQLNASVTNATGIQSNFNGAISEATGVLGKYGSDLLAAGQSAIGGAKAALDQFGAFSTVSKFVDKLGAAKKLQDIRPEGTKGKMTGIKGNVMQYPLDLGHYFIRFTFLSYYKNNPVVPRKELPQVSIFMPLPGELNERYGVSYADKQLGALGILQESGLLDKVSGNATDESMKDIGRRAGQMAASPGNLAAVAGSMTGLSDTAAGTAAMRAGGAVLNPYQALTFQGVELRSHSFKFRCSPNSEAEAEQLKQIIYQFKLRMLPEKKGLLFNFPDVCTIEFQTRNMPYSFKNCYLKSMSCNYAPSGTPSFFKGGKYPSEVEITLDFGEIEPVTRNDVEGGGNLTQGFGQAFNKPSGIAIPSTPISTDPTKTTPSRSAPAATIVQDPLGNVINRE
jgi:hypothetical protein